MVRQILEEYIWEGPDRFIPPFGDMKKGQKCMMTKEAADYFMSKGWLSQIAKSKGGGKSKTVKMTDNVGIGDSGK